ncbi:MAG: flagellar biosynthesis protein FlhA [Syntrophomonadaceae bacterium]
MYLNHGSLNIRRFSLAHHSDLLIAAMVVGIVVLIVIPVPPQVLDLLLAFSLSISMVILLTTLFITHPLQLSVFPSLLLVVTLYRLALNISSTRLILGKAEAGDIIAAFGSFVIGGNYVVGAVVFLIITIIQFVVITSGAGRVAEVAARFTLDAMPGKQMSIDADLNAGLITDQEARDRRKELQQESNFFGAMDGASKFVRGDAIAGIIIALVNIIGGLVIGMWQLGMPATTALQTYTLLTVGDGLVAQIPALLVSTATGILVTRVDSGRSFGLDLLGEIGAFPKVIALAAVLLFMLAVLPGLPFLPLAVMAAGLGYTSYALHREKKSQEEMRQKKSASKPAAKEPENISNLFQVDLLEIEIGYNLIPLADSEKGGDLLERLAAVRRQCATELGIYVRPIRIRDNLQLSPNEYRFKIRGIEMAGGELMPGCYMAMNPYDDEITVPGIKTTEPTFGIAAWWVKEEDREKAEIEFFTVVEASTVLVTHLTEFIKKYAHELITRQDVANLLDVVKNNNEALINELMPGLLSVGEIQKVLENLLREQISIRDLESILEGVADAARVSKHMDFLTESARQKLVRYISKKYSREEKITAYIIDPSLENLITESIHSTPSGDYPALPPEATEQVFSQLQDIEREFSELGLPPVIICSSRARLPFRRLIERYKPHFAVLAVNELVPSLQVEVKGSVKYDEN